MNRISRNPIALVRSISTRPGTSSITWPITGRNPIALVRSISTLVLILTGPSCLHFVAIPSL